MNSKVVTPGSQMRRLSGCQYSNFSIHAPMREERLVFTPSAARSVGMGCLQIAQPKEAPETPHAAPVLATSLLYLCPQRWGQLRAWGLWLLHTDIVPALLLKVFAVILGHLLPFQIFALVLVPGPARSWGSLLCWLLHEAELSQPKHPPRGTSMSSIPPLPKQHFSHPPPHGRFGVHRVTQSTSPGQHSPPKLPLPNMGQSSPAAGEKIPRLTSQKKPEEMLQALHREPLLSALLQTGPLMEQGSARDTMAFIPESPLQPWLQEATTRSPWLCPQPGSWFSLFAGPWAE